MRTKNEISDKLPLVPGEMEEEIGVQREENTEISIKGDLSVSNLDIIQRDMEGDQSGN